MWLIGPVEIDNPRVVRRKTTHNIQTVNVGDWPFLFSVGISPVVLTVEVYVNDLREQELYELSLNRNVQPVRIVDDDHRRSGFYYIRTHSGEERGGIVNWELTSIECYLYGGLGRYVQGYRVSNLETVTNDWGI